MALPLPRIYPVPEVATTSMLITVQLEENEAAKIQGGTILCSLFANILEIRESEQSEYATHLSSS